MVSARVLPSLVLNEIFKMSASPAVSRNAPCGHRLIGIKRNLFGSAEPAPLMETKPNSFSAELERHQELATQKWGFDFRADRPLANNASFIWERVSSQESNFAPQMYTLTRAAHVRPESSASPSDMDTLLNERADRENMANSSLDTDNEYDSQDDSLVGIVGNVVASTSAAASTASFSATSKSPAQRKRQLKITEFMKERKRLAQAPKKISPAKRMRTSSGSNSSNKTSASLSSRVGTH